MSFRRFVFLRFVLSTFCPFYVLSFYVLSFYILSFYVLSGYLIHSWDKALETVMFWNLFGYSFFYTVNLLTIYVLTEWVCYIVFKDLIVFFQLFRIVAKSLMYTDSPYVSQYTIKSVHLCSQSIPTGKKILETFNNHISKMFMYTCRRRILFSKTYVWPQYPGLLSYRLLANNNC